MDVNVAQQENSKVFRQRRKIKFNSISFLILFFFTIPLGCTILETYYIWVALYCAMYSIPYMLIGIVGLFASKSDKSSTLRVYYFLLIVFMGYCIFNLVLGILCFVLFYVNRRVTMIWFFFIIAACFYAYSIFHARKSMLDSRKLRDSLENGAPFQDPIIAGDYSMQQQYIQGQPNYGRVYQQPYNGYGNQQYSGYANPQFNQVYNNPQYGPVNNPAYRNPGNIPGFVNPAPVSSAATTNAANSPGLSSTGNNPSNNTGVSIPRSNPSNL